MRETEPLYCVRLYGYSFKIVQFRGYRAIKYLFLLPSSFDTLKKDKGKRGTHIKQFYCLCTHWVTQRFSACFQLFYYYFLNKKNLEGDTETVMIICSIDMMPLRLVSSFKLSFWQITIRLFPDQGGCAKPPCNACRNRGTNEGKKYLWDLDLAASVPLPGYLMNILLLCAVC